MQNRPRLFCLGVLASVFGSGPGTLYEKRWEEVAKFCTVLATMYIPLWESWDPVKYLALGKREADAEFNPRVLTSFLKDLHADGSDV